MTLVPFTDCCQLLGVDPKTLRLWLASARFSCTAHPGDARLKCLTPTQLQQLAHLHARPLPDPLPGVMQPPALAPLQPAISAAETDLRARLTVLQTQVAALQQQVTDLALILLRQSCAPSVPPPLPQPSVPVSTPRAPASSSRPHPTPTPVSTSSSARRQARSRALPLIEARPDGGYTIISPTRGVLDLVLDSPAWFDWLSSIEACSFRGQHGHFSATRTFRHGQRIQSWNIHRTWHGRSCTLYLGLTSALTIARLEQLAATATERLSAR